MISINHNILAANSAGKLQDHYAKLSGSVERLSTGLRVNSAADDAAGLAIRELMRADVQALNQGMRNANDAISLLQVADGALSIIDEKLIRMKELAEQAATGTYDSTQRLMIASEFAAMGDEINRIARATDFNGIHLLDGSLSGTHDGSGLNSKGAMKIHFGTLNDSAEDYYYVDIADCSLKGLGLSYTQKPQEEADPNGGTPDNTGNTGNTTPPLVSLFDMSGTTAVPFEMPAGGLTDFTTVFQNGVWGQYYGPGPNDAYNNFMVLIPAGTKNIVINQAGQISNNADYTVDNDIELFTTSGKHLAGTPLTDYVWSGNGFYFQSPPGYPDVVFPDSTLIKDQANLPFDEGDYDDTFLNTGPANYAPQTNSMTITQYNGMNIGYSGDPENHNYNPVNWNGSWYDYDVLTIDEAKEDLILWFTGVGSGFVKAYWDIPDDEFNALFAQPQPPAPPPIQPEPEPEQQVRVSIETQEKAQKALVQIDEAIVKKDKIRAHLGALQNRLENTVSNLSIQGENLQAAESRISDTDVAREMTEFVRNQVLTQSAVAMLGQANTFPHMLMSLLNG